MPRRRALRVLGTAAAVVAFPALRPGRARAHPGCPNPTQLHCSDGRFGTHYCCDHGMQCCKGACVLAESQCCTDPNGVGFGCPPREEFRASDRRTYRNKCNGGGTEGVCRQSITCPLGTTCCGAGSGAYECGSCCEKNEECAGKRCRAKCAKGRVRCGSKCCDK